MTLRLYAMSYDPPGQKVGDVHTNEGAAIVITNPEQECIDILAKNASQVEQYADSMGYKNAIIMRKPLVMLGDMPQHLDDWERN